MEVVNWGSSRSRNERRGPIPSAATPHPLASQSPSPTSVGIPALSLSAPQNKQPAPQAAYDLYEFGPGPVRVTHIGAGPELPSPTAPGPDHTRPNSAPSRTNVTPERQSGPPAQQKQHGRVSLYDHGHAVLGPKVLRDLAPSMIGSPPRSPGQFLRKGQGPELHVRTNLAQWLKRHPVNREPPFQPGNGGVCLDRNQLPAAQSIFRHLYDLGSIDFVAVRWVGPQNSLVWGRALRAGCMSWGPLPSEVQVAKWLPIFLEGIREYQALDTREPTTVAVALELMLLALRLAPKVAEVWVHHLWQLAPVFNLFVLKGKYCRGVDPAVTDATIARRLAKEKAKPSYQAWKAYTLA
ncbi:uncharacterized protein HaLaN_03365 [Haematococcus lacustris]|uniref:Uncharacterized protein n=1 Tax=Haematococcus lacustris TaxID=44745 RepID=A0A699YZ68_HAELA|nr:uncharacterized protein HaLaN_03365 [Haematococcus lacustris]